MTKPWSVARGALPFLAFGVLVGTLDRCMRLAGAAGHVDEELWSLHPPVISALGMYPPEHTWFGAGFTLLAVLMAFAFGTRTRMLAGDPRVRSSGMLRWSNRIGTLFWVLSMAAMLIMAWVPDGESPTHFIAALATFGLLALYELLHGAMSMALARRDDPALPRGPGVILSLWFLLCPIGAMACVYLWISIPSVAAQYAAVGLQFAYFLPLSPTLGQNTPRPTIG